jgi:hypothetical protein
MVEGWKGVDWTHLAQNREEWQTFEHGNEPFASEKGEKFLD